MKTIAIVIDTWKIKIFGRHLNDAEYVWHLHTGPSSDLYVLKVQTDDVEKLAQTIQAAALECASN